MPLRMDVHGTKVDRTCAEAAINGKLETLQYAHEHGCPRNEDTTIGAAESGHLETLKYAHESQCLWNTKNAVGVP